MVWPPLKPWPDNEVRRNRSGRILGQTCDIAYPGARCTEMAMLPHRKMGKLFQSIGRRCLPSRWSQKDRDRKSEHTSGWRRLMWVHVFMPMLTKPVRALANGLRN